MATLFNKIINFFKKKEVKHIEVDPDSIKKHNIIRAQQNKIAKLQAEINKIQIKEANEKKREEDKEKDIEVRKALDKQKKQIASKNIPKYFSLKKLFNKIRRDRRFRKSLSYYSFDGAKELASFEDMGFTEDGSFVLIGDGGEIILRAERPNNLFWSVAGLNTDVMSGKILIPVTKEGGYVENIMVWDPAKVIPIPGGRFKYSEAGKKPLYKLLADHQRKISILQGEIEQKDETLVELQTQNNTLKRDLRVLGKLNEASNKNLSEVESEGTEMAKSFRRLVRELAKSRDANTVIEANLDKLDRELEAMRSEAEREGVKLSDAKAIEQIKQIRRELIRDEPENPKVIERIIEKTPGLVQQKQ